MCVYVYVCKCVCVCGCYLCVDVICGMMTRRLTSVNISSLYVARCRLMSPGVTSCHEPLLSLLVSGADPENNDDDVFLLCSVCGGRTLVVKHWCTVATLSDEQVAGGSVRVM